MTSACHAFATLQAISYDTLSTANHHHLPSQANERHREEHYHPSADHRRIDLCTKEWAELARECTTRKSEVSPVHNRSSTRMWSPLSGEPHSQAFLQTSGQRRSPGVVPLQRTTSPNAETMHIFATTRVTEKRWCS